MRIHQGMEQSVRRPRNGVTPTDLAAAATRYLRGGWPILPARLPIRADGFAVSLRGLAAHLPPTDPAVARRWWSGGGHGIAVSTGTSFDVLTMPAAVARHVVASLPPGLVTAAARPDDRWAIPVIPGSPLPETLFGWRGVRLHAAGEYVLLPPTPLATGTITWVAGPLTAAHESPVALPHSVAVQRAALEALRAGPAGPR